MGIKSIGWLIIVGLLVKVTIVTCATAHAQSNVKVSIELYTAKKGARNRKILNVTQTVASRRLDSVGIRSLGDALIERVRNDTKSFPDNAPRTLSYSLSELQSGNYNGKPRPEGMEIKFMRSGGKQGQNVSGNKISGFLSGLREDATFSIGTLFLQGYSSQSIEIRRSGRTVSSLDGNDKIVLTRLSSEFSVWLKEAGEDNVALRGETDFVEHLNTYINQKHSAILKSGLDAEFGSSATLPTGPYPIKTTENITDQNRPGSPYNARPFPDYIAVIAFGR